MAPDWAEALAPVDERIAAMGAVPARGARRRARLPAGRGRRLPGVPAAAGRRAGARSSARTPTPRPATRSGCRFAVDARRAPAAAEPAQHLPGARRPTSASPPPPHGDLTAWADRGRDAAQPGAHRAARRVRRRTAAAAGRRSPTCAIDALVAPRRPVRRDPVGPRRPVAQADARRRSRGSSRRTRRPLSAAPRLLRLAAVQPGQPAARGAGRHRRSTGASPAPVGIKLNVATIMGDMNDSDARPLHRPRRPAAARRPALVGPAGRPGPQDLPRPKAILIVSAHWESAPVMLSADRRAAGLRLRRLRRRYYRMTYETPPRHRAGPAGRGDDAGHRAGAPARQPRPRPRRLGAAEDHVPRRRHPGAADVAADPRPDPPARRSASGCARCATRAC